MAAWDGDIVHHVRFHSHPFGDCHCRRFVKNHSGQENHRMNEFGINM